MQLKIFSTIAISSSLWVTSSFIPRHIKYHISMPSLRASTFPESKYTGFSPWLSQEVIFHSHVLRFGLFRHDHHESAEHHCHHQLEFHEAHSAAKASSASLSERHIQVFHLRGHDVWLEPSLWEEGVRLREGVGSTVSGVALSGDDCLGVEVSMVAKGNQVVKRSDLGTTYATWYNYSTDNGPAVCAGSRKTARCCRMEPQCLRNDCVKYRKLA